MYREPPIDHVLTEEGPLPFAGARLICFKSASFPECALLLTTDKDSYQLVNESVTKLETSLTRDTSLFSSDKAGTLRQRLDEIHETRSKQRRDAIRQLSNQGGMQ